ncbi:MAG: DNA polymerase III subunit delta [Candidatus Cloacimonadaceae bacterium]
MKSIPSREFLVQVAKAKRAAGYLIIGEDGYMTEKVYQGIRTIIRREIFPFETVTLYGDELTLSELSDYLDSYSIFAANRLIAIKNAHRFGEEDKNRRNIDRQKQFLQVIANYFQNPEPSQVVVLMAAAADGRITEWKKIKDFCQVIECEPIKFGGEMRHWLETSLRLQQKTMDETAKTLFLEKVELDFCSAENELEKLLVYVGERTHITEQDVFVTLPTSRLGPMSEFYRALGTKNTAKVIARILDMLNNEWADLQILSLIYKFFLTVWKIYALRAQQVTDKEITNYHLKELFESQRKDYVAYANNYKPDELPSIFQTILETDASIKLSKADSATLMTLCVVKICNPED